MTMGSCRADPSMNSVLVTSAQSAAGSFETSVCALVQERTVSGLRSRSRPRRRCSCERVDRVVGGSLQLLSGER